MAKKMTFKLRFEGTVGVSHVDIQGESLPGRGVSQGKALEVRVCLMCSRTSKVDSKTER